MQIHSELWWLLTKWAKVGKNLTILPHLQKLQFFLKKVAQKFVYVRKKQ